MFSLHRAAVLLSSLAFGFLSICFAEPASLTIYVHDDVGLDLSDLAKTTSELERLLRSGGAAPDVCVCRKGSETCSAQGAEDGRHLDLRILPGSARHMKNPSRPPLGHSIVDQRGGVYAVLFLDAIRQQASGSNVPVTTVLAYAAAHEISHLLLGANAHTPEGIMKATWEPSDYTAMKQRALHFNKEQCRRISECCKSTAQAKLARTR